MYEVNHREVFRGSRSRRVRVAHVAVALAAVASLLVAGAAAVAAQEQSNGQQTCILALNKDGSKVAKARTKVTEQCLKDAAAGTLSGGMGACLIADPKGKVGKAATKTGADDSAKCASAIPSFAYAGAPATNTVASEGAVDLVGDVLGGDLDTAVAPCASNRDQCRCQATVLKATDGLAVAAMKAFGKCKKTVLDHLPATSAADVANCLDDPLTAGSIAAESQAGGKLAETKAQMTEKIAAGCDTPGVTAGAFPGSCDGLAGSALGDCLDRQAKCRACQAIVEMDGFAQQPGSSIDCAALGCRSINPVIAKGDTTAYWPSLFVPADGLPVLSYYDGVGLVRVAKCSDTRCSGTPTVHVIGGGGWSNSLFVPADGLPVVSFLPYGGGPLQVAKCADAQCSAATLEVVDTTAGALASIFVPADARPVISYVGATGELRVARCGDASCSTGNSIQPVRPSVYGYGADSVFVPADGLPIVAYWEYGSYNIGVVKCGAADCSSGADEILATGEYPSLFVPADGLPVIAYRGYVDDLRVVKCADAACTASSDHSIAGAWNPTGTSLFVPADGRPVVAFTAPGGIVKVAKCADAQCSASRVVTIDHRVAGSYGAASLSVPADGLPVVAYNPMGLPLSYASLPGGFIKVAKCADPGCS